MNEVFLDKNFGREHVQELIQEAEQARLIQKLKHTQKNNHFLKRVRSVLLRALSVITS